MSASEELIVAGVNAVMTKHYPMADGVTAALVHEDIAVALDAVEPIIRADERKHLIECIEAAGCGICGKSYTQIEAEVRERLHRDGWATPEQLEAMIAAAKARVLIHERKRIAQEIEAHAEKVGAVDPPPQQDDYYAALHDAARIARGEQP